MRKTEKKTITVNGTPYEFSITQLGAIESGMLAAKFTKQYAPAFGGFQKAMKGQVSEAITEIVSVVDPESLRDLLLKLCRGRVVIKSEFHDLNESTIDDLFAGDLQALGQLLLFGFEVNYGSFFDFVKRQWARFDAEAKAKDPLTMPKA